MVKATTKKPARKAAAKKSAAKKATGKKGAVKKTARKAMAKKRPVKKAAAKKGSVKKSAAKKMVRKGAARKATAKKVVRKPAPADPRPRHRRAPRRLFDGFTRRRETAGCCSLAPSCARGFYCVAGCPLLLLQEVSSGRMGANGFSASVAKSSRRLWRRLAHGRLLRQTAREQRYLVSALASAGVHRTQWKVISSDRSGRNRTKVCPPQPPSPSSFAIPIHTRASAHGVPAAKFAAATAAAGLAAALRCRLGRWELPEPEAIQLIRAPRLDVAGAAAL